MTTASQAAPLVPEDWDYDNSEISQFTNDAATAGAVAWDLISHSQGLGPDLLRARRSNAPEGFESEDMFGFLFDLVELAAEIGFVYGKIDKAGFAPTWEGARLTSIDLARAIAALVREPLVENGQPFDPTYRARIADFEGHPARKAAIPLTAA